MKNTTGSSSYLNLLRTGDKLTVIQEERSDTKQADTSAVQMGTEGNADEEDLNNNYFRVRHFIMA